MAPPSATRSSAAAAATVLLRPHAAAALPSQNPQTPQTTTTAKRILNLHDPTRRPFADVPAGELLRSYLNLGLVSIPAAVDVGLAVVRSPLMRRSAAFRGSVVAALRGTAYAQFCAGEGLAEAGGRVERLRREGLRAILDYGLEDAADNDGCDRNLAGFLGTAKLAAVLPADSVSFGCVKISAICPISVLERVSDLLRWEQRDPSFHLPWKKDTLPIFSNSSPLYHTPSMPDPLTPDEELDLQLAQQRLSKLCNCCHESKLPLLVDAEYTSIQPAIDYLTYNAAIEFNKNGDFPIVYNTIQAYLRDAKERLVQATDAAERMGVAMGFKLVRGAYITRESQLASSLGAASPIHSNIHDTHACYNECGSFMLGKIAKGWGSIVLATHNIESGQVFAEKAHDLGIDKRSKKLQFAQLMGMADGLSYGLRDAGFCVSKYLPYGPVDQVIPYLLRRAEENKGLLSSSSLDRRLLRMELQRRLKKAIYGENSEEALRIHNVQ